MCPSEARRGGTFVKDTGWGTPSVDWKGAPFPQGYVCQEHREGCLEILTYKIFFLLCKSPGLICFQATASHKTHSKRDFCSLGKPGSLQCTNQKLYTWFSDYQLLSKDDLKYGSEHTVYPTPDSQAVFIEQLKLLVNLQKQPSLARKSLCSGQKLHASSLPLPLPHRTASPGAPRARWSRERCVGGCPHECTCVNVCGHTSTWRAAKHMAPKSSEGGGYVPRLFAACTLGLGWERRK